MSSFNEYGEIIPESDPSNDNSSFNEYGEIIPEPQSNDNSLFNEVYDVPRPPPRQQSYTTTSSNSISMGRFFVFMSGAVFVLMIFAVLYQVIFYNIHILSQSTTLKISTSTTIAQYEATEEVLEEVVFDHDNNDNNDSNDDIKNWLSSTNTPRPKPTNTPKPTREPTSTPDYEFAVRSTVLRYVDYKIQSTTYLDSSDLDEILIDPVLERQKRSTCWLDNEGYYYEYSNRDFDIEDVYMNGSRSAIVIARIRENRVLRKSNGTTHKVYGYEEYQAIYELERYGNDWYISCFQAVDDDNKLNCQVKLTDDDPC